MQTHDIPLHDIKTIVDVPEYSLYYLLVLIAVGVALFLGFVYLAYLWFERRNAFDIRRENIKLIQKLNLKDTKNTAYAISSLGAVFKDDSPRHESMYKNLTTRLEEYKYKKDVEGFDSETLGYIELYKEMLDV